MPRTTSRRKAGRKAARAGGKLPAERRRMLERAKAELRRLFGKK